MFKRYNFILAKDREKMIWTDRDLTFMCSFCLALGYIMGYLH